MKCQAQPKTLLLQHDLEISSRQDVTTGFLKLITKSYSIIVSLH